MPKRLSPAEKDKNMRAWLNRMRINQVHKAAQEANQVFTFKELVEADSARIEDWGLFGRSVPVLVLNDVNHAIVNYDQVADRLTVRKLGNEQNS